MILQRIAELEITPKRIISLVPSQTELLYDLGLEAMVAGITKFCVHPEGWRKTKPLIGGTKNINRASIDLLQPDLLIANKEENVQEQVQSLANDYPVWVTDVNNLSGAVQMIHDIGALTNTSVAADNIASTILQSFSAIPLPGTPLPAIYLIWQNPYMTVGGDTFIHAMMQFCNLRNVFATATRYPVISIEQIQQSGCRLLLLSSEPFPFNRTHLAELQEKLPGKKLILVDGEMFSWYGSRLLQSADYFKAFRTNNTLE